MVARRALIAALVVAGKASHQLLSFFEVGRFNLGNEIKRVCAAQRRRAPAIVQQLDIPILARAISESKVASPGREIRRSTVFIHRTLAFRLSRFWSVAPVLNAAGFEMIDASISFRPLTSHGQCALVRLCQTPDAFHSVKQRIGYRIFLVSGDEVSPLTKTAFDEFYFGRRAVLRNFAGKTVDIATVVCRLENTKLREVVRIYCQRFRIKGDGSIDEALMPRPRRAPATIREGIPRQDQRVPPADANSHLNGNRFVHSLTMISSTAQRKILEVLWK